MIKFKFYNNCHNCNKILPIMFTNSKKVYICESCIPAYKLFPSNKPIIAIYERGVYNGNYIWRNRIN